MFCAEAMATMPWLVMEIERILDDRLSMDDILGMESVGNIRSLLASRGKLSVEC